MKSRRRRRAKVIRSNGGVRNARSWRDHWYGFICKLAAESRRTSEAPIKRILIVQDTIVAGLLDKIDHPELGATIVNYNGGNE